MARRRLDGAGRRGASAPRKKQRASERRAIPACLAGTPARGGRGTPSAAVRACNGPAQHVMCAACRLLNQWRKLVCASSRSSVGTGDAPCSRRVTSTADEGSPARLGASRPLPNPLPVGEGTAASTRRDGPLPNPLPVGEGTAASTRRDGPLPNPLPVGEGIESVGEGTEITRASERCPCAAAG
jgi:hypothetical protein